MGCRVTLELGGTPQVATVPDGSQVFHAPTPATPPPDLGRALSSALDHPVASPRLEDLARPGARVLVVVSDDTRKEPRGALVRAVLERLPHDARVTVAVATGTHGPCELSRLGLGGDLGRPIDRWINHDGERRQDLVGVGQTRRGTPVAVHRAVTEADLVVATGCIIPHYFAGYGAGIKAVFPGLGGSREIRINHRLKQEPGARAGVVEGNPCREDLEEVAGMVPRPVFLLNAVVDDAGDVRGAVAGSVTAAFRAGVARCAPLYRVRAPASAWVVVSGRPPVTSSLYQASKLVAAAAPLVRAGGAVVVVADCERGVEPVNVVNRAIYEIGLAPRLPAGQRIVLVSTLSREVVQPTYCEWAPSLADALAGADEPVVVLPRAGSLLVEPEGKGPVA